MSKVHTEAKDRYGEARQINAFNIVCKHRGSSDTLLEVDWAAYPESAWCRLTIHCRNEQCAEAPSELIFEAPVY
jgi:hypothetical protein